MTDLLKLLKGDTYEVTEHISIQQPTLKEIAEFGEVRYMSLLSPFVCTPFDMIAQLDTVGIDFTSITDYQLFCLLVTSIPKEESQILFGDIDFRKYRAIQTENGIVLRDNNSVISEPIYRLISDYLRKMNNLSAPQYKEVGNELTKQKLIEYAYSDLKYAKRKKPKSNLANMISAATNHPYFKYGINEIWDMKVYAFYDAIKRIHIIEHTHNLYTGMYSGSIDTSSIRKKDFDWMRNSD